jgi:hypothetical protein
MLTLFKAQITQVGSNLHMLLEVTQSLSEASFVSFNLLKNGTKQITAIHDMKTNCTAWSKLITIHSLCDNAPTFERCKQNIYDKQVIDLKLNYKREA